MDLIVMTALHALSAGLLLFMLSAGLTLIFSMMGVLNFAHASFYMLGAYLAYALSGPLGFAWALCLAPLLVGLLGALFERYVLRRVHAQGHVAELLITFGLSYVVFEVVQLIWGRASLSFPPPPWLQGSAFTWVHEAQGGVQLFAGGAPAALCQPGAALLATCHSFPATRAFMMGVALLMLLLLWLLLHRTRIGLVIQAALTHPQMVEALGHNVPRVFMGVFGGGCALAALAGVVGGVSFVTEPAMAHALGPIIFVVVVVGGVGSLPGAFLASLLIGALQTVPLHIDASLASLAQELGLSLGEHSWAAPLLALRVAQLAPVLPYLLLVLMLILRPRGLLGARDGGAA